MPINNPTGTAQNAILKAKQNSPFVKNSACHWGARKAIATKQEKSLKKLIDKRPSLTEYPIAIRLPRQRGYTQFVFLTFFRSPVKTSFA